MGIFINLFIWEKGQQIFDVAWFNLILFGAWGIAFASGAKLLTKYSIGFIMRLSACCAGMTFILLSFVHFEPKLLYLAALAFPVGMTNGLYFSAQNMSASLFGKGKEFADFFSASNIIGQSIAFINPLLFALIIKWLGFTGSFLIMFVFIGLMITVSYYVPGLSLSKEREPLFQSFGIHQVFSTPSLRWMIPSLIAAGFFLQFQAIFSLIFTFSVTKDKLWIALLQIMYTTFTVGALLIYKKVKHAGRMNDSWWLSIGMGAVAVGFCIVLIPKAPILIVSNILTTVGLFFFLTIWNARQFIAIHELPPIVQVRILVWRELLLVVSRIVMLILILNVDHVQDAAFKVIMIFSFVSALFIPYFSKKGVTEKSPEHRAVQL